jgi:site-specific recombinase XerD
MTADAIFALAEQLIDTELEGNRTTPGYRKEVKRNVLWFFSWLRSRNINDLRAVGKNDLLAYYLYVCGQRQRTGTRKAGELISKRTINGRMSAAQKVCGVLYRNGYLEEDPFHALDLGLSPERTFKRRPFTEEEMAEFLEQIATDTPRGLRDRALFELVYSSGLRVGEAARLTVGDIDAQRREIVVHGKGSRDRLVPVSEVARDFLMLYLGERITRLEEAVFRGTRGKGAGKPMRPEEVTRRFHTLLVQFGMDGIGRSAHAVRHSTATHLLDHGASIRHVQELLGHKNIENTARYTQVQTGGLQKIYRKYHPGEHELFEAVDEAYLTRLENLIAGREETC